MLLLFTTVYTALALTKCLGKNAGSVLIGAFVVYLLSIGYGIYRGIVDVPEDSDSESDDEDSGSDDSSATEVSPLLADASGDQHPAHGRKHGLWYHVVQLIFGFIALSISGYVLSHSAASIADELNLSGSVLGVTILSFATTLPEKFVAIIGGARGHGGIVVASTAGSNIFLLTLCLGITLVAGNQKELANSMVPFEVFVAWGSSALFCLVVFLGSRQWIGAVMLVLYVAFIVLEFTVYRR